MSETEITTETPKEAGESAPPSSHRGMAHAALAVALLALVISSVMFYEQHKQAKTLEAALTQKLSDFEGHNNESLAYAKHAEETTSEASNRITQIEQQLESSRAQQESLQTLYLELANNRDEWTISEVEQLIVIASQQLQLANNIKPALLALQTADNRLQQIDKPQVIALRKVIGRDIAKLQALPSIDLVGMTLKLDTLMDASMKLPLVSERHPKAEKVIYPDWDSNPWHRLSEEIWGDIKQMVRIERMDKPEPPLLTPEQHFFLRENLKLRLLTARIALLQRDEAAYRSDLNMAQAWLSGHYDSHDANVQNALSTLRQLSSSAIIIQIPDISESLNSVRKYKAGLERTTP